MDLGRYDPVTEEALPPVTTIDAPPFDPEPGIRAEYHGVEGELDSVERGLPDAPRRHTDQPTPRADRAEDLLQPRTAEGSPTTAGLGLMDWNDDGAWNDRFGLDVIEDFR